MSAVGGASAKKGEFGKVGIFGMSDLSSPYVPGGPKGCSPERADSCGATFGYAANGTPLAQGYKSDVGREKLAFEESARRISSLQPKIDSKTWWFVRCASVATAARARAAQPAPKLVPSPTRAHAVSAPLPQRRAAHPGVQHALVDARPQRCGG